MILSVVYAQDSNQANSTVMLLLPFLFIVAGIACLIFWIQMLIDAT